jgi:hypothetical protein
MSRFTECFVDGSSPASGNPFQRKKSKALRSHRLFRPQTAAEAMTWSKLRNNYHIEFAVDFATSSSSGRTCACKRLVGLPCRTNEYRAFATGDSRH